MPGRPFFLVLLLLASAAGCERAIDPSVVEEGRAVAAPGTPNTLQFLFEEALRVEQRRHGSDGLEAALRGWEARQSEVHAAHAAADPAAVQVRLQALRDEEIRFVLKVFGNSAITRVLSESNIALANARFRLLEAQRQGANTISAEASAEEISQLLSRATALVASDPVRALDVATEAARLIAGIDDAILELRRLRGVETLFPEIANQLKAEELRAHVRMQTEAHAALRAGDRQRATRELAEVRAEEIRLVLEATDNGASGQLLKQVDGSIGELTLFLEALKATGTDAVRRERMLATARDLYQQASEAEQSGDHAKALDLASHAAGLLNSLRHLLLK